jgi:hypothetical protein
MSRKERLQRDTIIKNESVCATRFYLFEYVAFENSYISEKRIECPS